MKNIIAVGRLFYCAAIIIYGLQTIIIQDFRPALIPEFPMWVREVVVVPYIMGALFIISGIVASGLIKVSTGIQRNTFIYLGSFFLLAILLFHVPLRLIFSPHSAMHLGLWPDTLKELAFSGGAFVMANLFGDDESDRRLPVFTFQQVLRPAGRIFFAAAMTIMGYDHFVYPEFISGMVPDYISMPLFWTYVGGVALMGAGIAIAFKIFLKPVSLLLALMLFLWVFMFHMPYAIADPWLMPGDTITGVFDALLFCGVALVIAYSPKEQRQKSGHLRHTA